MDTGQKRLFAWMRDNGWLMKEGSSKNMPTPVSYTHLPAVTEPPGELI